MFSLLKMMFRPTPGWLSQVQANGQPAIAVVSSDPKEVEALKGGIGYEGRDGWIDVPVQVQPGDGAPFDAEMKCKLSQALFGRLAAGLKVNVRFDPKDKRRVLLVDDVQTLLSYRVKK